MKKIFLYLALTVAILSFNTKEQGILPRSSESQIINSTVKKSDEPRKIKVRVVINAKWVTFYEACVYGWWYCWEITTVSDARDYIKINDAEKLITFGIDNNNNPTYQANFIKGNDFEFPEDTYIKKEIVNAEIGLNKEVYIKKGLYRFENIDGILTITAPYSIVD